MLIAPLDAEDFVVITPTTETFLDRGRSPEFRVAASHRTSSKYALYVFLSAEPLTADRLRLGDAIRGRRFARILVKAGFERGLAPTPCKVDAAEWERFRGEPRVYYCAATYGELRPQDPFRATPIGETTPFLHRDHPENAALYRPVQGADARFRLSIDGNRIVRKEKGKKVAVVLRGVNLSGLQYRAWFLGLPTEDPAHQNLLEEPREPWERVAGIEEAQLDDLRRWGANVVRVTVNQDWALNGLAHPVNRRRASAVMYLEALDRVVQRATRRELYTIICLHTTGMRKPMYFRDENVSERRPCAGPDPKRELQRYFELEPYVGHLPDNGSSLFWAVVSSRYRRNPFVLFDLLNEPHRVDTGYHDTDAAHVLDPEPSPRPKDIYRNDPFAPYYEGKALRVSERYNQKNAWSDAWHDWVRVLHAIVYEANPDALILVSGFDGPVWSASLRTMPVRDDSGKPLANVIYSSHLYWQDWGSRTTQNHTTSPEMWEYWLNARSEASQPALTKAHPVFIGEWGVHTKQSLGIYRKGKAQDQSDFEEYPEACRNQIILRHWWQVARKIDGWGERVAKDEKLLGIPTDESMLAWGNSLLDFLDGTKKTAGKAGSPVEGIVGWAAWSYQNQPHIAARIDPIRDGALYELPKPASGSPGATGEPPPLHRLTDFGDLVRNQLKALAP